ncbi:DNA polymerase III subunit alpha [Streptomyces sp. SH5]|uniref:DNA polymerase III subunit alpha n=1 Tax=Streptomyces sp. SH5 TaxID=3041765 RepID=UPI002477FBF8|nr:DNA polymerase III subunit alpha [Streptomyces sp. SH5]WGP08374.1 DNA polymerase III subunit alpha [Streptomyces sp. SH5]
MSFTHLHAASGYSLRYGASHPSALAERAAERGLDALALTDRDSLAGAVRFAKACAEAGIRPLFGVDLAVPGMPASGPGPVKRQRTAPSRGGAFVAEAPQRAVFLARTERGWAELCRLVTAASDQGVTWEDLSCPDDELFVLLGADSEVGQALASGRPDRAATLLGPWRTRFGGSLRIATSWHGRSGTGPGSLRLAARMLGFATEQQVTPVLTNAVRYADPDRGEVADILDSARLLVPIDARDASRLDTGQRWLKDTGEMERIAGRIVEAAGGRGEDARRLLAATEETAEACVVDPGGAFGLGRLNLPEPELVGASADTADRALADRCAAGMLGRGYHREGERWDRLEDELRIIAGHGFAGYFLTVAEVAAQARRLGVRVAARGSGVGSLVTHLLGISPVDPVAHGLVMERFLSEHRSALPDIDLDVESARRLEVYQAVRERFGADRVATLAVYKTYRARGAIEVVARARGMAPDRAARLGKAFPHIRAKDVRAALAELPELREVAAEDHGRLWELVEALDELPFEAAMHPCGLLVSDAALGRRTPMAPTTVENIAMSQFDKEDIEDTGHPKIDVIGVRMQSALAHAAAEIERVTGEPVDLDDPAQVPPDDPATYDLISSGDTLGTFQLESPGQRELVRNLRPRSFGDLALDISLFRPGPVAAAMVEPLLKARESGGGTRYAHRDLRPILAETEGQVVYHEQVIEIMKVMTGCDRGMADEARRALSVPERQGRVRAWFADQARGRGYPVQVVRDVWKTLENFGSFGFAKAHAAAFAQPAYQSSWLKAHRMAALLAGLLTHDPGMYHKRVLAADARRHGVPLLLPDVNRSQVAHIIELVSGKWGVRIGLAQVRGITEAESGRIAAGQPYASVEDFWQRARPSRPLAERLARVGALSAFGARRELLLKIAELHRAGRGAGGSAAGQLPMAEVGSAQDAGGAENAPGVEDDSAADAVTGLPAMDASEQLAAELDVLGMDISHHLLDEHRSLLAAIGATPAADLAGLRHGSTVLVAGVKVATQTPPIRSGKRVIFATLDDPTGLSDLAFFEDSHGRCAHTVFHSSLLLVRGTLARRPPRAFSITGTAAWNLAELIDLYREGGPAAVADRLTRAESTPRRAVPRRTLTQPNGYALHPWADLQPPGAPASATLPALDALDGRSFHHASPGSAG